MNSRRALLIVTAAIIVIGAVVVFTVRRIAPTGSDTETAQAPAAESQGIAKVATAPRPQADAGEETPPWLQNGTAPDVAAAAPQTPEQRLREAQMQKLQASLRSLNAASMARAQDTRKPLIDALDTLEQMNDPAVTSQVNLKAVRKNLEIGFRMQELAQQLQTIAAQPASAQRQQQMDAIVAEVRKLQSQITTDVRAPGSSLPPPQSPVLPVH